MSATLAEADAETQRAAAPPRGPAARLARRILRAGLTHLREGGLTLVERGASHRFGSPGHPLQARIVVRDPRFWGAVVRRGSLGAAEAWMEGWWETDDVADVVAVVARNRSFLEQLDRRGAARLLRPVLRVLHALRRNTRRGARRNIAAHYDLGNDFFALFLDPTWTYSCAVFERPEMTLEEAQTAKYERLCRKLRLRPDDRVLEIGGGWGGFALHAASRYGCRVTTATVSREQLALARRRVAEAGLEDRVDVVFSDYRDLEGRYDKLVSIEMIEAVGAAHLDAFFRVCGERLAPDGLFALQAITTADRDYARSVRNVDFVKRYIFPGGQLVSLGAMGDAVARTTRLGLVHLEDLTAHYAETLARWRRNLLAQRDRARALGLDERFLRMWEYYLGYCEGGFRERANGVVQMVFAGPEARVAPLLGALPAPAATTAHAGAGAAHASPR